MPIKLQVVNPHQRRPKRIRRRVPRGRWPTGVAAGHGREIAAWLERYMRMMASTFSHIQRIEQNAAPAGDSALDAAPLEQILAALQAMRKQIQAGVDVPDEQLNQMVRRWGDQVRGRAVKQFGRELVVATGVAPFLNNRALAEAVNNAAKFSVGLIKDLPGDIAKRMEQTVVSGLRAGRRTKDLTQDIQALTGYGVNRAKLIAWDQTGKLYNGMIKEQHQQAGLEQFRWRTMDDPRVRPGAGKPHKEGYDHRELEGRVFSWKEGAPRTHTKTGFPGQDVRCRCWAELVLDEARKATGLPKAEDKTPKASPSEPKPKPAPKPAPAKRGLDERNPMPDFQPAKTVAEAEGRFYALTKVNERYTGDHFFARGVAFPDAKLDTLNAILRGTEQVLARHGVQVNRIGYTTKAVKGRFAACYLRSTANNSVGSLFIRKTYTQKSFEKTMVVSRARYADLRVADIKRYQDILAEPGKASNPALEQARRRLSFVQAETRWTVGDEFTNIADWLHVTMAHESYHAVYYQKNLGAAWEAILGKMGQAQATVEWHMVSRYGATNIKELWAEIGAAVEIGQADSIPPVLLRAFFDTLKFGGV